MKIKVKFLNCWQENYPEEGPEVVCVFLDTMFPNIKIVEAIRKEYPAGTRVRLVKMDDIQAPPLGTEGTVVGVDDTGSLLMHWDNGSHLNIVYGSDEVEKV